MPRSGTSFTASIFARQGYFAAEEGTNELRSGDEFNPGGYFESETVVEANVQILGRTGFPHHNTWLYESISEKQATAIDKLDRLERDRRLVDSFGSREPWIWKDPRLCYTLSYWWPLVDPEKTCVLVTRRDSADIWNSFVRLGWRQDTPENKSDVYRRIENHLATARASIKRYDIPHVEIPYEDYRRDPTEVARLLSETFGFAIEAHELGFRKAYDHSGLRGSIEQNLEKLAGVFPAQARSFAKKVLPAGFMRLLFPSRRS
jgi:hypothetical protein